MSNTNYWNNKDELSKQAIGHFYDMSVRYSSSISHSVLNSKIYDENHIFHQYNKIQNQPKISLLDTDTVSCLFDMNTPTKTAILNFASFKHPGGKFLEGSSAQEESLCHASTLYNVLSSYEFNDYYEYNRKNANKGLYLNRAIYTPDICFFYNDFEKRVDVITCAAPNVTAIMRYNRYIPIGIIENTINNRCKFILDVAEENNIRCLILGAFGCGVFGNNPEFIANSFMNLLTNEKYNFEEIIFAIPNNGHSSVNFNAFKNVLFSYKL